MKTTQRASMMRSFVFLALTTTISFALALVEPIGNKASRISIDNDGPNHIDDPGTSFGPEESNCSGMIRLRAYLPSHSKEAYRSMLLERLQSIGAPGLYDESHKNGNVPTKLGDSSSAAVPSVHVHSVQPNYVEFAPVSPDEFWTRFYAKTASSGDDEVSGSLVGPVPLHDLPATKLTIVLPNIFRETTPGTKSADRETSPAGDENEDALDDQRWGLSHHRASLRSMIDIWDRLGNDGGVPNDASPTSTFSVVDATSSRLCRASKSRKRRTKQTQQRASARSNHGDGGNPRSARRMPQQLVERVREELVRQNPGWRPAGNGSSSRDRGLSFSLTASSDREEGKEVVVDLELLALARVFPLRPPERRSRREKRLESFVVAKTAGILPGEVVLDPRCKRGSLLVEAAKFWPLAASFVGIDANPGHLEHARMNADSTFTLLDLRLPGGGGAPVIADKIVTCLPFGESTGRYHRLLGDWSRSLSDGGSMVLVVDRASLPNLLDAVASCRVDDPQRLVVALVRQPPLRWGADRAHVVVLRKTETGAAMDDETGVPGGLLPWEEEDAPGPEGWARIRRETIPPLVPLRRAELAKSQTNKVWLANGMVYQSGS